MLDPKYIPLFIGGFIAWICFMIFCGLDHQPWQK